MDIVALRDSLNANPSDVGVFQKLQDALLEAGQLAELKEVYEHVFPALQGTPELDRVLRLVDKHARKSEDPAIQQWLNAQLGLLFWKTLNNPDRAEVYFRRLQEHGTGQGGMIDEFYIQYYTRRDNWRRLEQLFLAQGSDAVTVKRKLANIAEEGGKTDKALAFWQAVYNEDPTDEATYSRLKELFSEVGKWHSLAELLKKRLKALPTDDTSAAVAVHLEMIGIYQEHIKSDTKVIAEWQKVLKLDPTNLHGSFGERVQEHAVVRDEQDGPRMVNEEGFQPLDALDVQVVRWLVEQQQVGLHQEEFRQLDAHFPSAAEFRHRPSHVLHLEPQALEDPMGLLLGAGCANRVEAFVGVAEFLNQVGVAIAFVIGALRHFFGQVCQSLFQELHFLKGLHGHFQDRGGLVVIHLLGEVADAVILGCADRSSRRFLVSGDDLQEGGLARAVSSDQADAVLVPDGQIQPLKQCAFPKVNPDRQQVQHGHASSTSAGQNQKRASRK